MCLSNSKYSLFQSNRLKSAGSLFPYFPYTFRVAKRLRHKRLHRLNEVIYCLKNCPSHPQYFEIHYLFLYVIYHSDNKRKFLSAVNELKINVQLKANPVNDNEMKCQRQLKRIFDDQSDLNFKNCKVIMIFFTPKLLWSLGLHTGQ